MGQTVTKPYNEANPTCAVNQCLQQVVGSIDNNAVAQAAACTSMFGSPTTSTFNFIPPVVTITVTVPYTDVIVTTSTTESTSYATSTSYAEVVETVTAYSATSIATVTEVVTAATKRRRGRGHRKRGCKPSSSSVPTATTPAVTPSPSTTETTSSSTEPAVSSPSSAPYPIASNCPSLEEYSSACSCINAVSGATTTITVAFPTGTTWVDVTDSAIVPPTSTSVVTVVVPSTVVVPAVTTVTATTTGVFQSTTTVTSTTTPVAPTQTAYLSVNDGTSAGKYVVLTGVKMVYSADATAGTLLFALPAAGGQPALADGTRKMYIDSNFIVSNQGSPLMMQTDTLASASAYYKPVTCDIHGDMVTCVAPSVGASLMYRCGTSIMLAKPTYTPSASCTVLAGLKMVST
ncbi:hypothetical protein NEMBOFW57_002197 [Staphylotrichum longicolle]|uniref:Uncharacterized protein n=1 Tax=Staphylotrichum longicolle TaxID=669026 RepID=A0AAD4F5S7_9PEZI|nr:hypothetical protein NEMBOFW57_002197 [Staphylotrichum longicolle]